jgi:hypothetical protein
MTAKTTQLVNSHLQAGTLLWKLAQSMRLVTMTTPVLPLLMSMLVKISLVFGLPVVYDQAQLPSKSEHSVRLHRQATGDQSEASSSL